MHWRCIKSSLKDRYNLNLIELLKFIKGRNRLVCHLCNSIILKNGFLLEWSFSSFLPPVWYHCRLRLLRRDRGQRFTLSGGELLGLCPYPLLIIHPVLTETDQQKHGGKNIYCSAVWEKVWTWVERACKAHELSAMLLSKVMQALCLRGGQFTHTDLLQRMWRSMCRLCLISSVWQLVHFGKKSGTAVSVQTRYDMCTPYLHLNIAACKCHHFAAANLCMLNKTK